MATPPLWQGLVFGGLFLLVGLGLLAAALRRVRKATTLLRTRSAAVADCSAGDLVTVEGSVESTTGDRVPAHFLNEAGVAVATKVQRKRRTGGGTGGTPGTSAGSRETWTTERVHFDAAPFAVADDTGRVSVRSPELDAFSTEASFWDSIRLDSRTTTDAPHVVGTAPSEFDEYAFDGEAVADTDADRRFEQGVLEPGDEVSVTGRVVRTDEGGLAIGAPDDPDAFTLSVEERGDTSVLGQSVGAVLLGLLGAALTVVGGGALAVTVLPRVL